MFQHKDRGAHTFFPERLAAVQSDAIFLSRCLFIYRESNKEIRLKVFILNLLMQGEKALQARATILFYLGIYTTADQMNATLVIPAVVPVPAEDHCAHTFFLEWLSTVQIIVLK